MRADEAALAADAKYVLHAAFGSSSCAALLRTVALATPVRVWVWYLYMYLLVGSGWLVIDSFGFEFC